MSSFLWPTRRTRRAGFSCLFSDPSFRSVYRGTQEGRRARPPRPHPLAQVPRHPLGDRRGAAIGLEPGDVEAEPLAPLPQVRVVDPTLVGEDGIVERPERVLPRGGLRGVGQRDRARVARAQREVAKDGRRAGVPEADGGDRAARAAEVGVHDDELAGGRVAADVVVGPDRRDGSAGEIAHRGLTVPVVSMRVFTLSREQVLPGTPGEVFPFFADARNLEAITPPLLKFEVVTPGDIPMRVGALIQYRLTLRGLPVGWLTSIQEWDPPHRFVDMQVRGPYALWHHTHTFEPHADGTLMTDRVRYAIGFGPFGELARRAFVRRDVEAIFDFRREA